MNSELRKQNDMNAIIDNSAEFQRRDFMKKYGKLAAVTPVVVTTLMSPSTSAAPKSCRGNGAKRC